MYVYPKHHTERDRFTLYPWEIQSQYYNQFPFLLVAYKVNQDQI